MMRGQTFFLVLTLLSSSLLTAQEDNASHGPTIIEVGSSAHQQGHPPAHAFDKSAASRWAAQGREHWIRLKLSEPTKLAGVLIGFTHGTRNYRFEVQARSDSGWKKLMEFQSRGRGDQAEAFAFPAVNTDEIRLLCRGSSANDWNNIHTIQLPGISVRLPRSGTESPSGMSDHPQLEFSRWSGDLNVPDPVAISFDTHGRAYVTQTQRRKAQDLDIRAYRDWIPDDVGFESVADKRDFYHRILADPKARVQDFNKDGVSDYRDLMVISEKIHVFEDSDNDGTADRTHLFAEGFQTEVTGIAAGVLWHDGSVYSTIAPDVWRLDDTDDDGRADQRTTIATGFGLHIAYAGHDMHGLTVGPDGRIYWTVGDKGISVTTKGGRRFHYPNQGGVMRCNPDGSGFEVFAHGLRNVQELAFDEFGNLFGVDNDADQPGERERVVYVVQGTDAGWRCNYQYRGGGYNPWTAERLWNTWFEGQAAYVTPPLSYSLNGPAGFAFNPGTALAPKYRGYFFLTGAPGGEQRAFRFAAVGASFRVEDEHEIGRGVPLVGINFGPDGGLYGVDWGGGYPLNQKGAIWKIDVPRASDSSARRNTWQLLKDGFRHRQIDQLAELLSHSDQRVRLGAQFELVRRDDQDMLIAIAEDTDAPQLARIHSIWGLGQLTRGSTGPVALLHDLLRDSDPQVQIATLRLVRELREFSPEPLVRLLESPNQHLQFHAAMALRQHVSEVGHGALIERAATLEPDEVYLRHACAWGLSGVSDPQFLKRLAVHPSVMVRLCAVLALRQQYDAGNILATGKWLAPFLFDSEVLVSTEAARAIYEMTFRYGFSGDSDIRGELETLVSALPGTKNLSAAFVRRAIGAGVLLGDSSHAQAVAAYAIRHDVPVELRREALAALRTWKEPGKLDRVDGRRRRFSNRIDPSTAVSASLVRLFRDRDASVRASALETSRALKVKFSDADMEELGSIVADAGADNELRLQSLNSLKAQNSAWLDDAVVAALASKSARLRMRARELLHEELALREIDQVLSGTENTRERQHAVMLLARLKSVIADRRIARLVTEQLPGSEGSGKTILLEVIEAALLRQKQNPVVAEAYAALEQTRAEAASENPLANWNECLIGGDEQRGEQIFKTHLTAACTRCHRVTDKGSTVGPDLRSVGAVRKRDHILRALVDPSADIEPKYKTQMLVLSSGKVVQGLPLRKTKKETVLASAQGKEIKVLNDEIEDSLEQKISIMPDMKKTLTRRELRDLVAWLATLKSNPVP